MSILFPYRHRLYTELQALYTDTDVHVLLGAPTIDYRTAIWLGPNLPLDSEPTSLVRKNNKTIRTEDFRLLVIAQVSGHAQLLDNEVRLSELEDVISNLIDTNASGWELPGVKSAHIENKRAIVHPIDQNMAEMEIEVMILGHTRNL